MGDAKGDGRATLREMFALLRAPDLEPEEKVLWGLYRSYQSPNGKGAYPGDELLAEHLGRSPRTVRRQRRRLLEAGYLEQQRRGPKPARYWAVLPDDEGDGADAPDPEDETEPQDEGVPWGLGEPPSLEGWGEASSYFAEGVQEVLWRSKQPPPDAPDGWSMGADLKRLKVVWSNLGTAGTVRRLWGLRYLAEDGELSCRGENGDLRRLEPDEGFTLGLLEHFRERGKWEDAERRFRERHDESDGDELAAAVEFARGQGGDA